MSFRYRLTLNVFAPSKSVKLTAEEYSGIKKAFDCIGLISYIEEEWDNVVQSYVELETELLTSAVHSMVLNDTDTFNDFHEVRRRISRRLSTLLSSCRAYLDSTPSHLDKLGVPEIKANFKEATNQAHKKDFSYRFMEALRNHAQHHGAPMHSAFFGASWIEVPGHEKDLSRYSVAGRVDLDKIRKNPKFKAEVRDELDPETRYLDVATLAREYLEGLSEVHETIRALLHPDYQAWKQTIERTISRYGKVNKGDVTGLTAQRLSGRNVVEGRFHIFDDIFKYVDLLIARNGSLINLRRRFVSGEPIKPARQIFRNLVADF